MNTKWLRWFPWTGSDASSMSAELREHAAKSKQAGEPGWCMCGDRIVIVTADEDGRLEAIEAKVLRTSKTAK